MTDIECLLETDIGIIISNGDADGGGDSTGVVARIRRCGVSVYHVSCCGQERGRVGETGSGEQVLLWWARDFKEILTSSLLNDHL
jgi:hypothetical protein